MESGLMRLSGRVKIQEGFLGMNVLNHSGFLKQKIALKLQFTLHRRLKPCPCGYFGDPKRECRCTPRQVETYRNKISGPLLDRIDIHVEVPAVEIRDLGGKQSAEPSAAIRERVIAARAVQSGRFKNTKGRTNAEMSHSQIKHHCKLDSSSDEMLRMAMTELQLSARAYDRILKVSRTIADLAGSSAIRAEHVAEAIQYRTLDRSLWR